MTNHGDDCYFYYYSTCTKGDSCPFRHCEAAMGNETVCTLWKEGCCFRKVCMFRHMEINKNRKEIACYWEKQPAGCQKPHCAFYHERPRFIDGVYVPPSKGVAKVEEPPHEEPVPPPTPLPIAANPQLRGVIKAETQETVPSPTHPPVVINPADDDEDEDDQFSEEGEDGTRLTSPRKLTGGPNSNETLNFGVSTLEEIRLRKALKASMKRAGYPVQSADATPRRNNGAHGEKENVLIFGRPACLQVSDAGQVTCDDNERPRGSVAERLGRKINNDLQAGEQVPLKRSLEARLGRVVDKADAAPLKALKPVRERLGFTAELTDSAAPATLASEAKGEAQKPTGQIRIKTLEEIRQEKAAKSQTESSSALPPAVPATKAISPKPTKGTKRVVTVKAALAAPVKTFSEALHAKKRRQQEQEKPPGPDEAKQARSNTATPSPAAPPAAEVKVKTLEEIRREKADRMRLQQAQEAENGRSPTAGPEEATSKKPRLLRISKPDSPAGGVTTQKTAEVPEKPVNVAEPSPASSNGVKVKTFEEIMREKRLRRQELEDQASSGSQSPASAETEAPQRPALKRKAPIRGSVTPLTVAEPSSTTSTVASDVTPPAQKAPLLKLTLASRSASPSSTSSAAAVSTSPKKGSSPRQSQANSPPCSPDSAKALPGKEKLRSQRVTSARLAKGATSKGSISPSLAGKAQSNSLDKPPETKVRPKLNVKPSVIKLAERVKPGQKRKAAERSAVAAVKPLNSASSAPEETLQGPPSKGREMFPSSNSEGHLAPVVPRSTGSRPSPLREELQTVPVFQQSAAHTLPVGSTCSGTAATREACAVPQSPVTKTPTQARPRRPSMTGARAPPASSAPASTVDDFEELMNEFNSGDHLEGDIDPGLGDDDLLQELSEMIDS